MRALLAPFTAALAFAAACHGDSTGPQLSAPAIDSIAPALAGAGAPLRIYGHRFGGPPTVSIGQTAASGVSLQGDSLLLATVPSGLVDGMIYDVTLRNADGGTTTKPAAFKAVIPPVVDSLSPRNGTTGTVVRFYGRSFSVDSVKVYFGAAASPLVQQQSGSLFASAPPGLVAGTSYTIRIANKDGSVDTLPNAFQAVAPSIGRVNGVTKPSGLVGMTVLIEGNAFGDYSHGKVLFTSGTTAIQAVIADTVNDWTNNYIVTTVPQGVASTSQITVQTATGTSTPVTFTLISGATFSPSVISWTRTTDLPQPLQGLGASFVPAATASAPTNYVFTVGGAADSTNAATISVFRAAVQSTGALGAWTTALTPLPSARAYHATVAATAYTAALDTTTTLAYLYAIGGVDGAGKTVSTVLYAKVALDGSVGVWQSGTPLPQPIHSASAVMFRGFIYLAGGADSLNKATATAYRAAVSADGSLGPWQAVAALPNRSAHLSLLNFGPYIYAVGGDSGVVAPVAAASTGTELGAASLARINLRDGSLPATWTPLTAMNKARSKHSTLAAGGYLFTTSGVYSGAAGSSENTYSPINSDGTVGSWLGATGSNTIGTLLGYNLYNQAAIAFTDATGRGHLLVLGGGKREAQGRASAGVVYY